MLKRPMCRLIGWWSHCCASRCIMCTLHFQHYIQEQIGAIHPSTCAANSNVPLLCMLYTETVCTKTPEVDPIMMCSAPQFICIPSTPLPAPQCTCCAPQHLHILQTSSSSYSTAKKTSITCSNSCRHSSVTHHASNPTWMLPPLQNKRQKLCACSSMKKSGGCEAR